MVRPPPPPMARAPTTETQTLLFSLLDTYIVFHDFGALMGVMLTVTTKLAPGGGAFLDEV